MSRNEGCHLETARIAIELSMDQKPSQLISELYQDADNEGEMVNNISQISCCSKEFFKNGILNRRK
jgi:hypothetical protein